MEGRVGKRGLEGVREGEREGRKRGKSGMGRLSSSNLIYVHITMKDRNSRMSTFFSEY